MQAGLTANRTVQLLYSYSLDDQCLATLATHLDDLLYAVRDGRESIAEDLLTPDSVGRQRDQGRRVPFCGREYAQYSDYPSKLTAQDNAETMGGGNSLH